MNVYPLPAAVTNGKRVLGTKTEAPSFHFLYGMRDAVQYLSLIHI